MPADPKTVEGLNTSAMMLSHLAAQYRVYRINLKKFGLKWLAAKIGKNYKGTEDQLDIFLKRIFYYRVDPDYEVGSVKGADDVKTILTNCLDMVNAILEYAVAQRKVAMEVRLDYTPDVYEHLIEEMEEQEYCLEQQLNLIKMLGEASYIGARLEDN